METNTLENKTGKEDINFVKVRSVLTGKELLVPREVYEQVAKGDKSVTRTEFNGFYVSPCFSFYESKKDYDDSAWED